MTVTDLQVEPNFFGKVAVIHGGSSAERDVSLKSGELVLRGLLEAGIDAHAFDPSTRPLSDLTVEGFSRVFNVLHGGYGENGQLQGALELLGIPYTGSGVLGSALSMDKLRSKLIWQQMGIPTPRFQAVIHGENYETRAREIVANLGPSLFVKPSNEGSSIAVTKVRTAEELVPAIIKAAKSDKVVLVEQSIEGGGEYSCCIAGDLDLPVLRIVPAVEFYDYHAKYIAEDTQYLIPCGLPAHTEARIKELARRAFAALGCRSWGRVDVMVDSKGEPYFLELNTSPGMTEHSLPPKAAFSIGVSYKDLVVRILSMTLSG